MKVAAWLAVGDRARADDRGDRLREAARSKVAPLVTTNAVIVGNALIAPSGERAREDSGGARVAARGAAEGQRAGPALGSARLPVSVPPKVAADGVVEREGGAVRWT